MTTADVPRGTIPTITELIGRYAPEHLQLQRTSRIELAARRPSPWRLVEVNLNADHWRARIDGVQLRVIRGLELWPIAAINQLDDDPTLIGWWHLSVSRPDRVLPTWAEMSAVRDWFLDSEAAVYQVMPPRSQYVNDHEVLHLWSRIDGGLILPDFRRSSDDGTHITI